MQNKTPIQKAVTLGQILEFEVLFPEEQPLSVGEYLAGGNRSIILNVAAYFLGFKSYNSKYDNPKELIGAIFGPENNAFATEVYTRIRNIESSGTRVGIINNYSSLTLFEYFFSKGDEAETQTHAEFERNLFKAYLVLNSEFTKAQMVAFSSTNELPESIKIPMITFCMQYPISDKENYDIKQIWATQMIKAIYLFQFLESYEKTQPLLQAFVKYFNSSDWVEYIKNLIPLTTSAITNENEAHTDIVVSPGEKFAEGCDFIEKLIVNDNDELDENDFLSLRAKPFYKIEDGKYRIIFNLFVVEKIFKGIYFLLRDVNNTLEKKHKIPGLKGIYGYEFSEKTLLYNVMDIIYPDKCIKYSGQHLADMHIDGAPDYYIRKGKNIMVFESKDFLIRADKKASFDYNVYEEEFAKTLYFEEQENGSEKAGAVMQLINTIKLLLKNQFSQDKEYYYKDVYIYPILITHDHQYDVPGFNNLVNEWFQDELQNLQGEGFFIHHIKPLAVINIDSLIYNQVGLSKNIALHDVLNKYYEQIKLIKILKFPSFAALKEYQMSKLIPFSLFIDRYFSKEGIWAPPPIFDLVAPALFAEEYKKLYGN